MTERNIINGTMAVFFADMVEYLHPLRWFALLALLIVFADLRFGIRASKKRGEVVRTSRAIRRTINKIMDYICWVLVAGAFGKAFGSYLGDQFLPSALLLVVFGIELNSCFSNYFEARGKRIKFDIFKFFSRKTEIIEIEEKEEKTK